MAGYEFNSVATDVAYTQLFAGNADIQKDVLTVADNQTLVLGTVMGVGGIPMTYNEYLQTAPVTIVGTNATDLFTLADHNFIAGDKVELTATTVPTGLALNTPYYIITVTDDTFQLSIDPGGSAAAFTADGVAVAIWREARVSDEFAGVLLKDVTTSGATASIAVAITGSFNSSALTFDTTASAALLDNILKKYNVFVNPVTAEL